MKLLILLALAIPSIALVPPQSTTPASDLQATTDALIFSTPMIEFQKTRDAVLSQPQKSKGSAPYGLLDWDSDGCSSSPDRPLGFDFVPACQRKHRCPQTQSRKESLLTCPAPGHDFGYRNYKLQGRWNEVNRLKIDNNLYADMRTICLTEDGVSKKVCRRVAKLYYKAVRKYGKDAKMVQREVERGLAMVESEAMVETMTESEGIDEALGSRA